MESSTDSLEASGLEIMEVEVVKEKNWRMIEMPQVGDSVA